MIIWRDNRDTNVKIASTNTETTPRGNPDKDKILTLILYLSGLSMSATGKIVGVTLHRAL